MTVDPDILDADVDSAMMRIQCEVGFLDAEGVHRDVITSALVRLLANCIRIAHDPQDRMTVFGAAVACLSDLVQSEEDDAS